MWLLVFDPLFWLALLPVALVPTLGRRLVSRRAEPASAEPATRFRESLKDSEICLAAAGWAVLISGLICGSTVIFWLGLMLLDASVVAATGWVVLDWLVATLRRRTFNSAAASEVIALPLTAPWVAIVTLLGR